MKAESLVCDPSVEWEVVLLLCLGTHVGSGR